MDKLPKLGQSPVAEVAVQFHGRKTPRVAATKAQKPQRPLTKAGLVQGRRIYDPAWIGRASHGGLASMFLFCSNLIWAPKMVKIMREPANDLLPPVDEDDLEEQEIEIKTARIRGDAEKYRSCPDLIEIAFVVALELGRLNGELVAARRQNRPRAERQALLDVECRKAREFNAICLAMTDEERARFDEIDLAAVQTTK